jgi:hypothetical protein
MANKKRQAVATAVAKKTVDNEPEKELYEVTVDGELFTVEVVTSGLSGCCGTRGQCPKMNNSLACNLSIT